MNLSIDPSTYLSLSPLPPHACMYMCVLTVGRDSRQKGY